MHSPDMNEQIEFSAGGIAALITFDVSVLVSMDKFHVTL